MRATPTPSTIGTLALLLAAWSTAGCAGAHLYRQADHELAVRAEASFKEARVAESVRGERVVLDQLLGQELAVVRRHAAARRDARLLAIAGASDAQSWTALMEVTQVA